MIVMGEGRIMRKRIVTILGISLLLLTSCAGKNVSQVAENQGGVVDEPAISSSAEKSQPTENNIVAAIEEEKVDLIQKHFLSLLCGKWQVQGIGCIRCWNVL